MKKVFVNGYGSIGSRIVSFLKDDPEIDYTASELASNHQVALDLIQ